MQQVGEGVVQADEEHLGRYYFYANSSPAPVDAQGASGEINEALLVDEIVTPELLFTENDTNFERLYGGHNVTPYVKDAFHDHIIPSHRPAPLKAEKLNGHSGSESGSDTDTPTGATTPTTEHPGVPPREFVNPEKKGTKVGAHYVFENVPGNGGCAVIRVKLTTQTPEQDSAIHDEENFDQVIEERRMDADEFYSRFNSGALSDDLRNIMRQGLAGMMW
jgi:hypothetical protein